MDKKISVINALILGLLLAILVGVGSFFFFKNDARTIYLDQATNGLAVMNGKVTQSGEQGVIAIEEAQKYNEVYVKIQDDTKILNQNGGSMSQSDIKAGQQVTVLAEDHAQYSSPMTFTRTYRIVVFDGN